MTRHLRLGDQVREVAVAAELALLNGGSINVYSDDRPAGPADDPLSQGAALLLTFTLGSPAFGASNGGIAVANTVAAVVSAAGEGHASWFRAFESDGVTAVLDGNVDEDGSADLTLSATEIFNGSTISIVNWTFVQPD